jgi:uncharacterized protein (TIGR03435 family)
VAFVRVPGLLAALGILQVVAMPSAQEPKAAFQFVSIRPVPGVCPQDVLCIGAGSRQPSPSPSTVSVLPGGRFEARNQTFETLARLAFGFEGVDPRNGMVTVPRSFSGEPGRYDITAVSDREWMPPPAGEMVPTELRTMLRKLLEERFQMKARLQARKVDVYALQLANREPAAGLRPSRGGCLGPYTDPRPGDDTPACPFRLERDFVAKPGSARRPVPTMIVEAGGVTMIEVARILSRVQFFNIDRALVDATGLKGTYDLRLSIDMPSAVDRLPFAFREALLQQLGLKLEKAKLDVPTLVVDRVKKPAED